MSGILFVIILYFCGGIPFSYLIPKIVKGLDIRNYGSGNVGSTNVIRNLGKRLGLVCLVLDALKVFIPLVIMQIVFREQENFYLYLCLASFAGVLGHDFPIFLGFKGGKGVASTMGVFFALNWLTGLLFFFTALSISLSTRLMSLASLTALIVAVVSVFPITRNWYFLVLYFSLAAFSFIQHRKNILRLLQGKENKF